MTPLSWFLCGSVAAIFLLIEIRGLSKRADFSYFVIETLILISIVVLGPVSLAVILMAMLLKFASGKNL